MFCWRFQVNVWSWIFAEAEEDLSRLSERMRMSAENQRSNDDARQVTQSITIVKPPGYLRSLSLDSRPSSPAGSSPPISPSSRK